MKTFIIAVLISFSTVISVHAAGPRYYYPTKTYSYTSSVISAGNDQERCQAEANHMAANNITGHVWGTIGSFEGVGYGSSSNCNTCTPSSNMRLTGDASAQGRNGMWYRVRSWR
jgi:hypothetical protein